MPYVSKPAFESYRAGLIKSGKAASDRQLVEFQESIVKVLDSIPELLFQKARRQNHKDGLLELSATWVGVDGSAHDVAGRFRRLWPSGALGDAEEKFWVGTSEEAVLLMFAASLPANRYITGKLLVTF